MATINYIWAEIRTPPHTLLLISFKHTLKISIVNGDVVMVMEAATGDRIIRSLELRMGVFYDPQWTCFCVSSCVVDSCAS